MGEIHVPDDAAADGPFPDVPNHWISSPKARLWLYRTLAAVLGLLIVYGAVNIEQAMAWAIVIGSGLGMGGAALASANVPRK